ncbi:MAG TPA: DUF5362 family protein [Flavobacterium sp.]|uniref:DUF5362 family protein n=1 Tax=Flavobacterium sp. TaxID=239 RepID=UPI002CEB861A|nr:DUF5362 family protein [Flavobacterium sp.]HNP33207.1 DUF5362 family protein [Flavobacterium sp.]
MEEKLSLNDLSIAALRESGKWCMFLSIVGFIFIGLMLIFGVFMSVAMAAMPSTEMGGTNEAALAVSMVASMKAYFGIIYIVCALVYIFPVYYLYNYAKGIKQAVAFGNSDTLATALVNLKSHHKFLGIFTIIMLSLYVLFFIGAIIFGAIFASTMH